MNNAIKLIETERNRQVSQEGWDHSHDDAHRQGELARAAACYAVGRDVPEYRGVLGGGPGFDDSPRIHRLWPWDAEWWKPTPKDRIRELVKAGALIVAEIERLQRMKQP